MPWEITAEELLARYADGERDFRGIELIQSEGVPLDSSIDLEGAILRDINLRGAYLRQADLCRADLTGADLFGVSLEGAWLKRAIVRDANLYSANLSWCDLTEADLGGTNLAQMNASSAVFCGANISSFEFAILIKTNFRDAYIAPNIIWSYGNFVYQTTMPDGTIKGGPFFGEF
ncbi:pentapeptide repeat-containing protein [Nostoc sp. JL33]|uniref:pentapeptide repeat-containing protein n=1 Tax=Nostoc sp. JL33 TaxID=2815396 RepID=UPI0025D68960|nr:pentapeptide repeat-containing protein [Nostoc sp. JL33]MBN3873856.1 pentapeptide repeat-containing protein [Nostoc sp. JL33]